MAFVTVAMAIATAGMWRVATETSDIKSAIGKLSELASQTKRQADAMIQQLALPQ
jgi:hypothetical protein